MRALLRDPERGQGVFALLEGEAGIGKSALLDATLARARERAWQVRVAAGDELEARRPFALVEAALGAVETPVTATGAGLAGIVRPYVDMSASEELIARVTELAAQRPLLLALEDVQWADVASLAVLGRLAQRVAGLPVLVLLTARPDIPTIALEWPISPGWWPARWLICSPGCERLNRLG